MQEAVLAFFAGGMKLTDFGLARMFGSPEAGKYTNQVPLLHEFPLAELMLMNVFCMWSETQDETGLGCIVFGTAQCIHGLRGRAVCMSINATLHIPITLGAARRCSRGGTGPQSSCLGAHATGRPAICGLQDASLQVQHTTLTEDTCRLLTAATQPPAFRHQRLVRYLDSSMPANARVGDSASQRNYC